MSEQHTATYQPPVAKLLTLGECKLTKTEDWRDYRQDLGLTAADIPELIRMMTDAKLWQSEEGQDAWSVIHAWRALGQLKAVEAIAPLLSQWDRYEDDDWLVCEAPSVFQVMGIDALPALASAMADQSLNEWARSAPTEGLVNIAEQEPEHRAACLDVLMRQMEAYNDNPELLNGMLVAALLDLNAVEAVDLIEQAYVAKKVDDSVPGTWATVQIELGLKSESDFSPADLRPQFFPDLSSALPMAAASGVSAGFGKMLQQPDLKSLQGFAKGGSKAAKGNKKKKKK